MILEKTPTESTIEWCMSETKSWDGIGFGRWKRKSIGTGYSNGRVVVEFSILFMGIRSLKCASNIIPFSRDQLDMALSNFSVPTQCIVGFNGKQSLANISFFDKIISFFGENKQQKNRQNNLSIDRLLHRPKKIRRVYCQRILEDKFKQVITRTLTHRIVWRGVDWWRVTGEDRNIYFEHRQLTKRKS